MSLAVDLANDFQHLTTVPRRADVETWKRSRLRPLTPDELHLDVTVERVLAQLYPGEDYDPWQCDRPKCDGHPHPGWEHEHARWQQIPPRYLDPANLTDWLIWAYIAGRGSGKTRAASEHVTKRVKRGGARRVALVGRTPADVRQVMIEGPSGLIKVGEEHGIRPVYKTSLRQLEWPNGAIGISYSAEVQGQLRGPEHDLAWCDEPAAWTDARLGDALDTAFNNLMLGLRILTGGLPPQCLFTTTPKRVKLVRDVLGRRTTVRSTSSTYDNLANLAPAFRESVMAAYEGTRIGRQELMGELLDDVEGALWTLAMLDEWRLYEPPAEGFKRVVVAVDPAMTSGEDSDETGIIVVARGYDDRGYVLGDYTIPREEQPTPERWARRAVQAFDDFAADCIVAEGNQGGELVTGVIRAQRPGIPVKRVTAKYGKRTRAEPVSTLYELGRFSHVGSFPKLEDQMTTWIPDSGESPDRMDALVWGATELGLTGTYDFLAAAPATGGSNGWVQLDSGLEVPVGNDQRDEPMNFTV